MNFRSKWALVLVMFPTLILSVFGVWLYYITQQEQIKREATRRLLLEQYPVWAKAVNEYIIRDKDLSINLTEAKELIERQRNLKKDSLYLSVDSLIVLKSLDFDSVAFSYNYHKVGIDRRPLKSGDIMFDAKYIVNNKKEVLGLKHNETGYLLILQTALEVLRTGFKTAQNRPVPQFFNANLCINDAIINQRVSLIGFDTTGKYLIQLSSRMPDATYDNRNNKIAIPQALYNLLKWFLSISWLLLIATIVTFFLYRHIVRLSAKAHRWLTSLNKATCAIAIADKKGNLKYANETYQHWNNNQGVEGQNLIEPNSNSQMERIIENVIAQAGKTAYYSSVLGSKNVHSGITYDAETESLIIVDTDVSTLRNMYDGELHSLKNLIQEVKELNARIILGDVPMSDKERVLEILRNNNHTLEKALLFYENNRGALSGNTYNDLITFDLELGVERIVRWFDSLVIPLGIRFEIDIPGFEVRGTINSIELVFHNAIFNAIQALREAQAGGEKVIRISATLIGTEVIVDVSDNGIPFPGNADVQEQMEAARGYGLKIMQGEMEKIGGRLIGIQTAEQGFKSLQFAFQHV